MLLDFFRIKQSFFFFNDTATTEIYTLSLHDALPISLMSVIPISASPVRTVFAESTSRIFTVIDWVAVYQIGRAHV